MGESPNKGRKNACGFTIELESRNQVKSVAVPNGAQGVLIEGTIGTLKRVGFLDGVVLEVAGENGTLRVDLARDDLAKHASNAEGERRNW